jgi:hypothetical protein
MTLPPGFLAVDEDPLRALPRHSPASRLVLDVTRDRLPKFGCGSDVLIKGASTCWTCLRSMAMSGVGLNSGSGWDRK